MLFVALESPAAFVHHPRMDKISKCPTCKSPLEATVKVHLNNVVADSDGNILEYKFAFGTFDDEVTNGESVDVYCANDHVFKES